MLPIHPRSAVFLFAAASCAAPLARAQGEADFYRAYHLEHAEGKLEAARDLYLAVAEGKQAPADLRAEARRAALWIAEDLAAADMTRLVPRETILYAELSRPGEELKTLLGSLGLSGRVEEGRGFGVSPALVDGLLGLRSAAVAVTAIDPERGPRGLLLLHPGELGLVRGLIETALSAAAPTEPIAGFPAWTVKEQAVVVLSHRLCIAGTDRDAVESVLARLAGKGGPSLAENEALRATLERGKGSLLSFCVHAEPALPLVTGMLAQEAARDPGAAAMLALLDPGSLRSLSGFVDVDPEGVGVEIALELAEGHRSLAFHLLRMQPVDRDTLARVPAGTAFFAALGMNPKAAGAPLPRDAAGQPVVSLFDLGRELFGNLRDVVVYGLPPADGAEGGIPDLAVALRSNDPERTRALCALGLGLAGGASGGRVEPERVSVAERPAERFALGRVPLFLAVHEDGVLLSPSRRALERSLATHGGEPSVLADPAFERGVAVLERGHVLAAMANVGRCVSFAGATMDAGERAALAPYGELLSDTVVTLGLEHTDTRLALRARASSLPDVSSLVGAAVAPRPGADGAALLRLAASGETEASQAPLERHEEAPGAVAAGGG